MKTINTQRSLLLFLICLIINGCNQKSIKNGNSSIINEDIARGIKEYYLNNKIALSDEFVFNISSARHQDTIVLSVSYNLELSLILNNKPNIYGYIDSIPYLYYTGDENIFRYNNDSATFNIFISQVFKNQYSKYVVKKVNLSPPPTGVCQIIRLFIYNGKLIKKEYDDNTIKGVHEIKYGKKTTGNKKLDSLLNIK